MYLCIYVFIYTCMYIYTYLCIFASFAYDIFCIVYSDIWKLRFLRSNNHHLPRSGWLQRAADLPRHGAFQSLRTGLRTIPRTLRTVQGGGWWVFGVKFAFEVFFGNGGVTTLLHCFFFMRSIYFHTRFVHIYVQIHVFLFKLCIARCIYKKKVMSISGHEELLLSFSLQPFRWWR